MPFVLTWLVFREVDWILNVWSNMIGIYFENFFNRWIFHSLSMNSYDVFILKIMIRKFFRSNDEIFLNWVLFILQINGSILNFFEMKSYDLAPIRRLPTLYTYSSNCIVNEMYCFLTWNNIQISRFVSQCCIISGEPVR